MFKNTQFNTHNSNDYNVNTYSEVYGEGSNNQLSVNNEPSIQYNEVVSYLAISSKDRDVLIYPDVNNYVINFPTEFKNVTSIQLIQAIFPDQNNIRDEPYLLLKIDELEDVMVSNDRNISDAFAIIQMSTPAKAGGFINMEAKIHENTVKYFKTPKASLSRLTVRITDYSGSPFIFDASPGLTKAYQNTFVFKITTMEKARMVLSQRNVF